LETPSLSGFRLFVLVLFIHFQDGVRPAHRTSECGRHSGHPLLVVDSLSHIASVLEKRVNDAIGDPTAHTPQGIAVGREMRAHVKALEPSERIDFIRSAMTSGDERTVNALLNAPGYLSGMPVGWITSARMTSMRFAAQEYTQLIAT
jgi:hypothetical protein